MNCQTELKFQKLKQFIQKNKCLIFQNLQIGVLTMCNAGLLVFINALINASVNSSCAHVVMA